MGWESFTAFIVAMVQTPCDGALHPMENSPPGIHTMPSGAFAGAGVLLGTVGVKSWPKAGIRQATLIARAAATKHE